MYKILIPVLLLAGGAVAATPQVDREEAAIAKRVADMVPGKPQDCISPSPSRGASRAGNVTLTEDRSGKLYMSRFQGGCTVSSHDALISRRPSDRLCRGDIVEARDLASGMTSGSCVYGDFVPYNRR